MFDQFCFRHVPPLHNNQVPKGGYITLLIVRTTAAGFQLYFHVVSSPKKGVQFGMGVRLALKNCYTRPFFLAQSNWLISLFGGVHAYLGVRQPMGHAR